MNKRKRLTNWDVAELARTALNSYGFTCELETGGGGTPEIFVPFTIELETQQLSARLHYATYAYDGLCVETDPDNTGDFQEGPAYPRLEIDYTTPIGRQLKEYLDELLPLTSNWRLREATRA